MSAGRALLLRWGAGAGVLLLLLLVLHFLAPPLRVKFRERTLPGGYENVGIFGPFLLFARPDNQAAKDAVAILDRFTSAVVAEYGGPLHLKPGGDRTEVIVFSDQSDLEVFGREELGSDFEYNGGFYLPAWRTIGVVGSAYPAQLVGPLAHEGTHMMLDFWVDASGPDWSRWFDEGVATYFEASDFRGPGIRLGGVKSGILRRAREAVAANAWPPLEKLFAAPAAAWESEENGLYYSEAAMLVHLLLEGRGGALRERFFAWYEVERRPGPVSPEEFARVVGPLDEVEAALREHVRSLR